MQSFVWKSSAWMQCKRVFLSVWKRVWLLSEIVSAKEKKKRKYLSQTNFLIRLNKHTHQSKTKQRSNRVCMPFENTIGRTMKISARKEIAATLSFQKKTFLKDRIMKMTFPASILPSLKPVVINYVDIIFQKWILIAKMKWRMNQKLLKQNHEELKMFVKLLNLNSHPKMIQFINLDHFKPSAR